MIRRALPFVVAVGFLASSCIRSEGPGTEADILECTVDGVTLRGDPAITNTAVMVLISGGSDRRALAPRFSITEGATIEPLSGTVRDFTTAQTYVVNSEDGKHSKTYTVSIIDADAPSLFKFDNWNHVGKYEVPYEPVITGIADTDLEMGIWASGNAGYAIVHGENPEDFPTAKTTDRVAGTYAAKLETKSTGFGPLPLAAGNLFLGTFNAGIAMISPLKATKFGVPYNKKPLRFTGYYKYRPGRDYLSGGTVMPDMVDSCRLYAVLYEKGPGDPLDGTNVTTDSRIIAYAEVNKPQPQTDFTRFDVDFKYDGYTTPFVVEKMLSYEYYLAVVFAASYKGSEFKGAVGSTLIVDEVEIIYDDTP